MRAIILAAGRGKRLKPLTDEIPKTLIEVNGQTILSRSIKTLNECGIRGIIVVTGYLSDMVANAVHDYDDVEILYNEYYLTTDNMYSVMLCKDKCADESILIMNGDLIVSKQIIELSMDNESSNMPIDLDPSIKDGQRVIIKNNRITEISKKLSIAHGTAINILVLSREDAIIYFDYIDKIISIDKRSNEWWEVALNETLNKINVKPIDIRQNVWLEIDDFEDLKRANDLVSYIKG